MHIFRRNPVRCRKNGVARHLTAAPMRTVSDIVPGKSLSISGGWMCRPNGVATQGRPGNVRQLAGGDQRGRWEMISLMAEIRWPALVVLTAAADL